MAASLASTFWDYYICDYSLFDRFLQMNHRRAAMNLEIFLSGIVFIGIESQFEFLSSRINFSCPKKSLKGKSHFDYISLLSFLNIAVEPN